MLTLLLADNLLLLYLGWEGVGLCSYLLIGFWYQDPVNGRAARKAFIVTRVGDTAMAIGLFLLFIAWARSDPGSDARGASPVARRIRVLRSRRRRCCWAGQWANRRSCRCKPGCRTRWPVLRRSAP